MEGGDDGTVEGKAEKVNVSQEVRQRMNWISLMKQQLAVTHTVRQNGILAFVDSWVADAPSVKMLRPRKNSLLLIIVEKKVLKCWSIQDLSRFLCLVNLCIGELRQIAVS
jgi:hypothetical protein